MNVEECSTCGAEALVSRGDYDFVESGLEYVVLHNIELVTCEKCGNIDPIIRQPKKLMEQLIVAVASKPDRLDGHDIRFIRKQLEFTQEAFGRLIHVDKTTISKWENGADPVGVASDLLIRSIAITLSDLPQDRGRRIVEGFGQILTSHVLHQMNLDAANDYELQIETVAP